MICPSEMENWFHISIPNGREFSFKEGEFIALEGYDDVEKKKYRLYLRVTKTMVEDEVFLHLLSSGKYEIVMDLTVKEKEHIYNTCY